MSDKYTRRFLCLIRCGFYLASIFSIIADYTRLAGITFLCAVVLAGGQYKYYVPLAKRYKWVGIAWVAYFLIFLIHVIMVKGRVFHSPMNLFFFMLPWVSEIICFEVGEFRKELERT
jgi:hypothetical protein